MRKIILGAAALAVPLLSTAASAAHDPRPYGYGRYDREVRQEARECRRELRRADSRREYRSELRECRKELRSARREARRDWRDYSYDRSRYGYRW